MNPSDHQQHQYFEKDQGFRPYQHPIVIFFAKQRFEFLSQYVSFNEINNTLDVGCGSGFSDWLMKDYVKDNWGVDFSLNMLAEHPLKHTGKILQAKAQELPFSDKQFDLVYGWEVLHHIEKPEEAVLEMARVSRKYVIIAEPNPFNPAQFGFAMYDKQHRWVLRYTLKYMQNLFNKTGLEIIKVCRGGYIFPNNSKRG